MRSKPTSGCERENSSGATNDHVHHARLHVSCHVQTIFEHDLSSAGIPTYDPRFLPPPPSPLLSLPLFVPLYEDADQYGNTDHPSNQRRDALSFFSHFSIRYELQVQAINEDYFLRGGFYISRKMRKRR